jgi:endonuclease-3
MLDKKERYQRVIEYFQQHNPRPESELRYENPYQLLVAVMLSAQCTDKRVNSQTPALFAAYPTPEQLAEAPVEEIYGFIKSISYPNSKAKHLKAMAGMLLTRFQGVVPGRTQDLEQLPGVGRKTANVIASIVYHQPKMAVDTHVFRVSRRIGLTVDAKNPRQAEKQLVENIPQALIPMAHHWLILHGRYVCLARKPRCQECAISSLCVYGQEHVQP